VDEGYGIRGADLDPASRVSDCSCGKRFDRNAQTAPARPRRLLYPFGVLEARRLAFLVLEPTRELAAASGDAFRDYGRFTDYE